MHIPLSDLRWYAAFHDEGDHPHIHMMAWSQKLGTAKGKKSYGYLPKNLKSLVDKIVDEMEQMPVISECYETWWGLQCQVNDFHSKQDRQRPPLSKQKEFRAIKNAVIREAEVIRSGAVTFEDEDLKREDEQRDNGGASMDYWYLKRVIYDESYLLEDRNEAVEGLRSMAEDGDPHAQYLMGKLYRDGPLLTPDWVNAGYWFTQAAEQNHPEAQYALGKLYLSDDIEVRDPERGVQWLERATQNGSDYAAYRLGKEYLRGRVIGKGRRVVRTGGRERKSVRPVYAG